MKTCGWCDQSSKDVNPISGKFEPYHECIECGSQIDSWICDNNEGLCNDCRYKLEGRVDK